mmetsp:Transcript_14317/g.40735  ORF Transcript_14317/g.40735 Transcript_14317/m.40735 type:complete len:205 (+) Transcript_14317:2-616(+)
MDFTIHTALSFTLQVWLHHSQQSVLHQCAFDSILLSSVLQDEHGGQSSDAILLRHIWMLVAIYLHNPNLVSQFFCHHLQLRCHHLARSAPRCIHVQQNGRIAGLQFRLQLFPVQISNLSWPYHSRDAEPGRSFHVGVDGLDELLLLHEVAPPYLTLGAFLPQLADPHGTKLCQILLQICAIQLHRCFGRRVVWFCVRLTVHNIC